MSVYIIQNEKHLAKIGAAIAKALNAGDTILLSGEMGTGKTTLVKKICESLKCPAPARSPSFTLVNQYDANQKTIYHIDLYRTNSIKELDLLDLDHYYANPNAVVFIEWAEKLGALTPPKFLQIHLYYFKKNTRKLTLKHKGKKYKLLKEIIKKSFLHNTPLARLKDGRGAGSEGTLNVERRTSHVGRRTSDLGRRTSDLAHRTSHVAHRTSDVGRP